jgi:hypothetical protein
MEEAKKQQKTKQHPHPPQKKTKKQNKKIK